MNLLNPRMKRFCTVFAIPLWRITMLKYSFTLMNGIRRPKSFWMLDQMTSFAGCEINAEFSRDYSATKYPCSEGGGLVDLMHIYNTCLITSGSNYSLSEKGREPVIPCFRLTCYYTNLYFTNCMNLHHGTCSFLMLKCFSNCMCTVFPRCVHAQ